MAISLILKLPVFLCLPQYIEFIRSQRDTLQNDSSDVKEGINYSITLNAACYMEGALEAGLKAMLYRRKKLYSKLNISDFEMRRSLNLLFNNMTEELELKISRATGPSSFDELFKIVINQPLSKFSRILPIWEGFAVLFQFRNVIAHGKEISTTLELVKRKSSLSETFATLFNFDEKELFEEYFAGGYKKAEDYLLKNNLIDKRFRNNTCLYFSDQVADHFWSLAQKFLKELSESLSEEDKTAFDSAVWPSPRVSKET